MESHRHPGRHRDDPGPAARRRGGARLPAPGQRGLVYVHWGTEGDACPPAEARAFRWRDGRGGCTIVVGTHAHLLLGDGWLGKTSSSMDSATSCGGVTTRTATTRACCG
ncbi:CapA family protein [Micromonospora sp. ATA32]|nr:CapA family protein [Micromonospora sp. ATA32]